MLELLHLRIMNPKILFMLCIDIYLIFRLRVGSSPRNIYPAISWNLIFDDVVICHGGIISSICRIIYKYRNVLHVDTKHQLHTTAGQSPRPAKISFLIALHNIILPILLKK